MAKITVLSPVHIGTGEVIPNICYHSNKRYDFADILSNIQISDLTDINKLDKIKSPNRNYSLLNVYGLDQSALDKKCRPLYKIANSQCDYKYKMKEVKEQIKTCNEPYIPGSTIKGSIMTSWVYYILNKFEDRFEDVRNYYIHVILEIKQKDKKHKSKKSSQYNIDKYRDDIEKLEEDIKQLRECIWCSDVKFDQVTINKFTKTLGKKCLSDYAECIPRGSTKQCDKLFVIKSDEIDRLQLHYTELKKYFSKKIIIDACNTFTKDILDIKLKGKATGKLGKFKIGDNNYNPERFLENSDNTMILQIGQYTNHFSKSSLYAFDKKTSDCYIKTVKICDDGQKKDLPGFIRIDFDD